MNRTRIARIPARRATALTVVAALIALLATLALTPAVQSANASKPAPPKPTIVLVHGAWADSSGWNDVVERLQKRGYDVFAPATPLRSLEGDAAYLASVLAQTPGPIVLVGHSYGGAVITNAAAGNPNVRALVYVNAFAPELGEDTLHLAGADSLIPTSIEFKGIPPFGPNDVDVYIKKANFRETFAGDLPEKLTAVLAATQRPVALAAGAEPTTATAWRTIPSWYLLARQDRTITPAAQRFMATRAGSTIVEVDAAHLTMFSRPGAVVDLIEAAAGQTG